MILCIAGILVFACSRDTANRDEEKSSPHVIFKADSTFLAQFESNAAGDTLTSAQVKEWAGSFAEKDTLSGLPFIVQEFYKLDSLKKTGGYADYVSRLDIGMTKEVIAQAVNELKVDSSTTLKIWLLKHSSYEACPFTAGAELLCTVVYKGRIADGFLLAYDVRSSDPPVWMNSELSGEIFSDGRVVMQFRENSCDGESDNKGNEVVYREVRDISFTIKDGKKSDVVNRLHQE